MILLRPPRHPVRPPIRLLVLTALLASLQGCSLLGGAPTAPTVAPTQPAAPAAPLLVSFDDDGSPDGTTALLFLLSDPAVRLVSASISYGEAYPDVYIQHVGRLLDDFGFVDIPLGAGPAAPVAGDNAFPEFMREGANDFWGLPLPNAERTYPVQDVASLLVSVSKGSDQPVTVFASGPLTNLALALRKDPSIRQRLEAVYIMGGAVYVPGNLRDLAPDSPNTAAEWNIYADPVAAQEVFDSGVDLYLVPLDATNQVEITRRDTAAWRSGGEIADFAADLYQGLMDSWGTKSAAVWDVMTAAILTDPELCRFEALHLDVVTDDGSESGRTVVRTGETPNVNVCLDPDVDGILQALTVVFSSQRP